MGNKLLCCVLDQDILALAERTKDLVPFPTALEGRHVLLQPLDPVSDSESLFSTRPGRYGAAPERWNGDG